MTVQKLRSTGKHQIRFDYRTASVLKGHPLSDFGKVARDSFAWKPVHHGHRLHQSLLERVQCLAD
eukprot:4457290-Amphidinium_carterae.1